MSATKNYLHDYSEAFDFAWSALEEAKRRLGELNDLVYDGQEIRCHVMPSDIDLLAAEIKGINQELNCYHAAKEPSRLAPILPGEVRFA